MITATEQRCVDRYVAFLADRIGADLVEIWLFGSAARGDLRPAHSPMRSDVDMLVLCDAPLAAPLIEELINATYPLFLECGRQISPQFWTVERFSAPENERARAFVERVRAEGRVLHRGPAVNDGLIS